MNIRRTIITVGVSTALLFVGRGAPPGRDAALSVGGETTLAAVLGENACEMPGVAAQDAPWPDWGAADIVGGDVPPARKVSDPYPILHSVAIDPDNERVVMSDPNLHALWSYDRHAASKGNEAVTPISGIRGPSTGMMFVANVKVDPRRREIYSVDNDIGDRLMVFPYDADGNVKPIRVLNVPHQAWGISINDKRDELALTVESSRMVVIYRREASRSDAPLRVIRGPKTGLGDPHGVYFDAVNDEIVVANHGNQGGRPAPDGRAGGVRGERQQSGPVAGGRFEPPSITVYGGDANGDVDPKRRIQGAATKLNWPMSIDVDADRDEIAVANNGDSSILIFKRGDTGNVAPARILKGPLTGIAGPMGVGFDRKNGELWVANYGDHTALVFARDASGNVPPKRILRNAPAGSPTIGFGNPGAVAYDTKRGEILVPN